LKKKALKKNNRFLLGVLGSLMKRKKKQNYVKKLGSKGAIN